ncbi:SAM-dependent methyltransferase [Streptomyces sp. NPDC004610]|uniref:SAM-dependent methyltransferase n=1 Tax=unclassified Streptomyces TaxID=2593676 RepID=UPI00339EB152
MPVDPVMVNSEVPHSARIWNYWLGGKDCYEVDQEVGDRIREGNPAIIEIARAQRAFLVRAVEYLVREAGVRQFLDVGTGLPTADNTHEVAQRLDPAARIVYVDHDPIVLAHAEALLTTTPEGATAYVDADLRDPEGILAQAAGTLDLAEPVALMLLGITAHITDDSVYGIVGRLMDALPAGSHLVLCDDTEVIRPEAMRRMIEDWNRAGDNPRVNRSPREIARFFAGLEVVEPGVVSVSRWRGEGEEVDDFGGVGRK